MKGLQELLLKEEARLQEIVQIVKERLKGAPEGKLRISKSHGYPQYYRCMGEKKGGQYIAKEKEDLIQRLAQKTSDEKVLRMAEKRLDQIKKLTESYEEDEISKIYLKENEERQKLILPVEQTWEQILKEWISEKYEGKEFQEGTSVILTEKGERVRSKSEKIMADHFFHHGIEYKYECPLHLKGTGIVYPDFTFLSKRTGQEIYWEHCGMVDSPTYARSMVRKINAYERNGIFSGERLILTYETEQTILNTEKIEQMIQKYL
ncbi:MAG: hypothetical protein IKT45_04490 [Lachnospiraceae bacterium]|nr:hypothetical protein [Lachnospiraceae bacterium]